MEIVSRPFNGKNYWKNNGYTLLDGASAKRRPIQVVKLTGGDPKRRRFWRLKKAPKLLLSVLRPRKVWERLRDGYMNMMMRVAGDVGRLNGGNDFLGKRIAGARKGRVPSAKRSQEFENRLVLEIYKAMATSRGISEVY